MDKKFKELERIRKEIYKLEYYSEKVKEQLGYLMYLTNQTAYEFGGKSGVKVEEEIRKEMEEASNKEK